MSTIDEQLFKKSFKEGSPLKCCICIGILEDPQRLQCGHSFCGHCVQQLKQQICPVDRIPFLPKDISPDRNIKMVIEELDVFCTKKLKGCTWEGEYGQIISHLKNACNFQEINCPDCNELKLRPELESHKQTCPNRKVPCEWCKSLVKLTETLQHGEICPDKMVECYLGCKQNIPRKTIGNHTFSECEFAISACSLSKYGCTWTGLKKESAEHMKDTALHLDLALKALKVYEEKEEKAKEKATKILAAKTSLSNVLLKISDAISGGASRYDKGDKWGCYQLYLQTSTDLVKMAEESGQANEFWAVVLKRAIELAAQSAIPLGMQDDPPWILRKGFEAVKTGARNRGEDVSDRDHFWVRIKDTFGFLKLV